MKELDEYRKGLLNKFEEVADSFRAECLAVKDPFTPLNGTGWNVHQIAAHTRDVDKLAYGLRARRTALENNPAFPSFSGETYMSEQYDTAEPLGDMLDGLVANVRELIQLLQALPPSGWSRLSSHAQLGGGLTLQSWVEKDLAHIEEHLETVKKQNRR